MSLLSSVFPEAISKDALGGPGFSTDVVIYGSGLESRSDNWSQARLRWEVSHAARYPAAFNPLIAHFRNAKGRAKAFPFKDWSDYQETDGGAAGVFTMLTSTTFQLTKRYTSTSATVDRYIYLPKSSTVVVTGGSGASVNYATGVVTVSSGTPTAWTGQFYVPCRYDTDEMRGHIVEQTGGRVLIMGWESIPVIETRDYT